MFARVFLSTLLLVSATVALPSFAAKAPDSNHLFKSGARELKRKHYEKARDHLQEALNVDSTLVGARIALARAYLALREYGKATTEFSSALDSIDKNSSTDSDLLVQLRHERAQAEHFDGHYDAALKDLTWIIDQNAATGATYLQRASAFDALGHTKLAIEELGKALRLAPKDADVYLQRALLYKHLGEKENAMADFDAAVRIKPALASWRASFHLAEGRHQEALADYGKAIVAHDGCDKATQLCNRASIYADLDDHRKAIDDLTDAIELSPDKAEYYARRGVSYFGVSDFKNALADFSEAIRLSPTDADYYFRRAEAYAVDGQKDKALRDYDEAIKLAPSHAAVYFFRRALVASEMDQHQQAIEDLTKAIELDPGNADYVFNRALEYRTMNDLRSSEADLTKAIELRPHFASAYKYRATVRAKLGEHALALQDLHKSMSIYNGNGDLYGVAEVKRLLSRLSKEKS